MELNSASPDARACCPSGAMWKFPVLLGVVLLAMALWNRGESADQHASPPERIAAWSPSPAATGEIVRLEIDFGNGAHRVFDALPYQAGMTVADVMAHAGSFRPGISFKQVGEGAAAFLTELEGLKNEGASGRNWQYEVAGDPGTKSFCLQSVGAGELVRWSFAGADANR